MENNQSKTGSSSDTQPITIKRGATNPPQKAPAEYFTGNVSVTHLIAPHDPARTSGGSVTFEPGARSAWHTHPFGQSLIIVAGSGRVQSWGGAMQEFGAGDVVWIPAGVKHWHGAAPHGPMTHLAIQENLNGKAADWLEKVTDEQYGSTPAHAVETDLQKVSPALDAYNSEHLLGEVWKRPGLSARDRSLVTIAVMIARSQAEALIFHLDQAINNGVTPAEIAELLMHLAFYSGWGNAIGAVAAIKEVFARRNISPDQLPMAQVDLLSFDEAGEAGRAEAVEANFGATAPGVVQYTTQALFRNLWLRPGLQPRDRSLVTVSALIASGQVAQVTYHLNRAMDNGLTQTEASEALTQLAFYAGWPHVFSALPAVKDVFEKRPR